MKSRFASPALGLSLLLGSGLALAQAAAPEAAASAAAVAAEAAPKVDSGDTAWMLTSTLLVILMTIPGLALFYGGLTRSKNMLSVLMQVFVVFSLISILWAVFGYSLAFSGEGNFVGGFDKLFLKGVTTDTIGALATIPEYVFVAFQGTFAAITVARPSASTKLSFIWRLPSSPARKVTRNATAHCGWVAGNSRA